jgi:hypothetical protein
MRRRHTVMPADATYVGDKVYSHLAYVYTQLHRLNHMLGTETV